MSAETPSFEEIAEVVTQARCPHCKRVGQMTLVKDLRSKPLGSYSVAGTQPKLAMTVVWVATCAGCTSRFDLLGAAYDD